MNVLLLCLDENSVVSRIDSFSKSNYPLDSVLLKQFANQTVTLFQIIYQPSYQVHKKIYRIYFTKVIIDEIGICKFNSLPYITMDELKDYDYLFSFNPTLSEKMLSILATPQKKTNKFSKGIYSKELSEFNIKFLRYYRIRWIKYRSNYKRYYCKRDKALTC